MPIPDSLAEKIALFEEAAIVIRDDNELFTEEAWGQVFIGQGLEPRALSPLTKSIPRDELAQYLAKFADSYRTAAAALPTHREFVESMLAKSGQLKKVFA
jgi:tryptophan halogenase